MNRSQLSQELPTLPPASVSFVFSFIVLVVIVYYMQTDWLTPFVIYSV
jgi:hypothetical protein